MTVKVGKGCGISFGGFPGALSETLITQKPKFGMAGVRGHIAYYVAKPGYQGPDEFAYVHLGTDQYGGPIRGSIKQKVTVIP